MQFQFNHVHLESFGTHLPEKIITSLQLEEALAPLYERIGLVPGRLELMTGISERRFWEDGTMPSQVAAIAGQHALDNAQIDPSQIGLLMNTSVSRDCLEPATANMVHSALQLSHDTMVLDLSNACLGFLNGMVFAANLIESGVIKAALITAGEHGGPLVDSTIKMLNTNPNITRKNCKNSFASLTIGSGAVAAVLTHDSISQTTHKLLGGVSRNHTEFCNLCMGGGAGKTKSDTGLVGGHILMETDSEELLHRGVALAKETFEEFLTLPGMSRETPHHLFSHQVGAAHRKLMYESLKLPMEKDYATVDFLGNVGSVSLPLTMAYGIKERQVRPKDQIAMLGIGSGINCMMLHLEW
jgi:3-oxoacyl-[acyl-carrier-protein] synthase-3